VPKLVVTLRKTFGFGSTVMGQNPFDHQTLSLAFPGVTMDAMPAASGGKSAKLDDATQAAVEEKQASGPWAMAGGLTFDDVIDPRELRNKLIDGLGLLEGRRASRRPGR
jgi:acetyl-CoA carboxylase carboxyltransferase component